MTSLLRIFKYCRNRIIKLSIENKQLKLRIQFLEAILESQNVQKQ
jgi:hypothetical protein